MFKGYEGAAGVVVELRDFSQLENATKIHFEVFIADGNGSKVLLSGERQRKQIESLNVTNITVEDNNTLQWDDADECASSELNKCFKHSHCINTLDSYTCVCFPGYFDFSEVGSTEGALCDGGKFQNAMLVVGGTAGFLLLALFGVIVLKVIVMQRVASRKDCGTTESP
ncbi:UNVERIFIED_CONTAM: hypothetical protein FKN15_033662 [Acipenser sinensis]